MSKMFNTLFIIFISILYCIVMINSTFASIVVDFAKDVFLDKSQQIIITKNFFTIIKDDKQLEANYLKVEYVNLDNMDKNLKIMIILISRGYMQSIMLYLLT